MLAVLKAYQHKVGVGGGKQQCKLKRHAMLLNVLKTLLAVVSNSCNRLMSQTMC
jgi:hypothetical protein